MVFVNEDGFVWRGEFGFGFPGAERDSDEIGVVQGSGVAFDLFVRVNDVGGAMVFGGVFRGAAEDVGEGDLIFAHEVGKLGVGSEETGAVVDVFRESLDVILVADSVAAGAALKDGFAEYGDGVLVVKDGEVAGDGETCGFAGLVGVAA